MRVAAIIISGLATFAAAATPATAQQNSIISAAKSAESAALHSAELKISSERAHQTLSGAAASQAKHNSKVLASALAAASNEASLIAHAESLVKSEESKAEASISKAIAKATGK